jgi:hypothetical protein
MAFRTTPSLGPQIDEVFTGVPYWDEQTGLMIDATAAPSYRLGNKEFGSDGAEYIWVQASANIASTNTTGTQVTVTTAGAAATGSGGYYTPPATAITSGQYFHARKGAYNAVV